MVLIKLFSDKSELYFDKGAFDNWCVYLARPKQIRYAPTDLEYFARLNDLGNIHGANKIYNDFVHYYALTTREINSQVLNLIQQLSQKYYPDQLEIEILFTILYAGMIAEENKEKAILKKRIKRLGMHQLLIEKLSPEKASEYSRGRKWNELDIICKQKGF